MPSALTTRKISSFTFFSRVLNELSRPALLCACRIRLQCGATSHQWRCACHLAAAPRSTRARASGSLDATEWLRSKARSKKTGAAACSQMRVSEWRIVTRPRARRRIMLGGMCSLARDRAGGAERQSHCRRGERAPHSPRPSGGERSSADPSPSRRDPSSELKSVTLSRIKFETLVNSTQHDISHAHYTLAGGARPRGARAEVRRPERARIAPCAYDTRGCGMRGARPGPARRRLEALAE